MGGVPGEPVDKLHTAAAEVRVLPDSCELVETGDRGLELPAVDAQRIAQFPHGLGEGLASRPSG